MPTFENPYRAPEAEIEIIRSQTPDEGPSARAVFLEWERLRLIYNGILALETLALGGFLGLFDRDDFWIEAIAGAVGVNVCFSAGATFEGYLNVMGFDRRVARGMVFAFGTMLSCVFAGAYVYSMGR